jgi:diacylglycerol kinase family enzyme
MAGSQSSSKTVYVVLNGKKSGDEDLRKAVSHLRKEGHKVEVRVTYESGDSERIAEEALNNNSDVIVAAGGDGSVNELAGALIKLNAPEETCIAVIPMGTANDFATAAGIPEDPWEALQLAVADTAYPIDVGMVNDEVFMNVATGGFGTEITAQTDEGLKNKLGGAAYLLTGISKPGSVSAKEATGRVPLTAYTKRDDEYQKIQIGPDHFAEVKDNARHGEKVAEFSGSLLVLAVGNSRQAGGGRELCPDAIIDDGLLDVSYIINPSLDQIPNIMGNLLDGSSSMSDMKELFGTLRCNWLEVDCPDELQVNRDGEPMRATKYQFEILPHRLYLHLPNTKLLNRRKDHDTLSDTSSNSAAASRK